MSGRAIKNLKILAALLIIFGLIALASLLNPTESSAKDRSATTPGSPSP